MNFPFNLYAMAFVAAAAISALSLPLWRSWCQRTGLVDDPGHRKIHDEPVALAGGLAVMTGLFVPTLAAAIGLLFEPNLVASDAGLGLAGKAPSRQWIALLEYGLSKRALQLTAIFVGAFAMLILGWLDDRHELRPAIKFGGQLLVATLVAAAGVRITLFVDNIVFSFAITILWIVAITNAFNFMDNMNGLCAGLGAIGAWSFAWSAAVQGQYLVALLAWLSCGALLGFLPYNFPKASAFLGDAGSHLVGYLLAVLAILPHFYSKENQNVWAVLRPLLILAVPILDLVWVVGLRWRMGKPFYVGDTNHFSHRLVRRGLSRSQAVVVIWIIAAALCAVSFW